MYCQNTTNKWQVWRKIQKNNRVKTLRHQFLNQGSPARYAHRLVVYNIDIFHTETFRTQHTNQNKETVLQQTSESHLIFPLLCQWNIKLPTLLFLKASPAYFRMDTALRFHCFFWVTFFLLNRKKSITTWQALTTLSF